MSRSGDTLRLLPDLYRYRRRSYFRYESKYQTAGLYIENRGYSIAWRAHGLGAFVHCV